MVVQWTRILHHEHLLGNNKVAGIVIFTFQFFHVEDLRKKCGECWMYSGNSE
jgi:hypothetical protein